MVNKSIFPVFWALFAAFILLVFVMVGFMGPPLRPLIENNLGVNFVPLLFLVSGALFFLLGLALLVLAIKVKVDKIFKTFLILTGAAAVGIFVSMLLHNLVYGIFIQLFGEGFWQRTGIEDEPFFFMMAVIVCPIAFLVGTVSSIVLMIRKEILRRTPNV